MQRFEGSICQVKGIKIGQAQNFSAQTGVTVVLVEGEGATVGADVRGAAPGTRETDLARPGNLVQKANAVVLSGGSAFGLASVDGVMQYLSQQGIGYATPFAKVPIVPAAVLYDLGQGSSNTWPTAQMGLEACHNASSSMQEGLFGAGCGATVGKLLPQLKCGRGGVGTASLTLPSGITVGAVVAVNAVGDIYHPHTSQLLMSGQNNRGQFISAMQLLQQGQLNFSFQPSAENTTIGVVACDANLSKEQVNRLALVAHDGLAKTICPVHTLFDGDTCFALATGHFNDFDFLHITMAATQVMAHAVVNAIIAGNQL